jgi:hypothetical protein
MKTAKAAGVMSKNSGRSSFSMLGPTTQTKLNVLELGSLRAEQVPVIVIDHPTVEAASKVLGPIEGILGFPFFARYKMTLDYRARRMTFIPSGYQPKDVIQALMATLISRERPARTVLGSAALWGLQVDKKAGDTEPGVDIATVFPNSAAFRAGLRSGDRLLVLDDHWTDSVEDCFRAAASVKAGAEGTVLIHRSGENMEFVVKPTQGL